MRRICIHYPQVYWQELLRVFWHCCLHLLNHFDQLIEQTEMAAFSPSVDMYACGLYGRTKEENQMTAILQDNLQIITSYFIQFFDVDNHIPLICSILESSYSYFSSTAAFITWDKMLLVMVQLPPEQQNHSQHPWYHPLLLHRRREMILIFPH